MSTELCGCCKPRTPLVPDEPENRPALSAIAYRIGTFASFRQAILDELASVPALRPLRTRLSQDYTITTVELWAAVADVLTFYQERMANEGYLRTARVRDSVGRLARLIDYRLRPGAAALATLAFTLERDEALRLLAGLRVQSVPAEGEKPQKFETLEPLAADSRLNRLRVLPPPRAINPLAQGRLEAFLAPGEEALAAAAGLVPGDVLVLQRSDAMERITVRELQVRDDRIAVSWAAPVRTTGWDEQTTARKLGQDFRLFGHNAPPRFMAMVTPVTPVDALPHWGEWLTDFDYTPTGGRLYLDGRFETLSTGVQMLLVQPAGGGGVTAQVVTVTEVTQESAPALGSTPAPGNSPPDGTTPPSPPVAAGVVTRLTVTPTTGTLSDPLDVRRVVLYELLGPPLRFWAFEYPGFLTAPEAYLSGRRVGWETVEVERTIAGEAYEPGVVLRLSDLERGRQVLLTDEAAVAPAKVMNARIAGIDLRVGPTAADATSLVELGLGSGAQRSTVLASAVLPSSLTFSNSRRELSVTIGALGPWTISLEAASPTLAGVRTALEQRIRNAHPTAPPFALARVFEIADRLVVLPGVTGDEVVFGPTAADSTTVGELGLDPARVRHADGVISAQFPPALTLSRPAPQLAVSAGLLGTLTISLAGLPPSPTLGQVATRIQTALAAGTGTPFSAAQVHAVGNRLLLLPGIPAEDVAEYLVLELAVEETLALQSREAVLLGNVVLASHGESVRPETLGDGDAAVPFQRFPLAKSPVTHLPGAGASGVASTLELLVDGVKWQEVPTLYGRGPTEQVYVTHLADDGTRTVQGGDGETGARIPSGRGNVVARYRQGLGLAGRVRAQALTTLLDRPKGLRSVTNLLPSDGGADPEPLAEARRNAPGTVRTFGRAVSLRDFEVVARASGEVAKAHATWVWGGDARAVHLTVAGQLGATFSADALARFKAVLDAQRDINIPLRLDNYLRVPIVVTATLHVDERRVAEEVAAAARTQLLAALSFEALPFGGAVHLSDTYAVLQEVPGVLAVDVNRLHFKNQDPAFLDERGADTSPVQGRLRVFPARPRQGTPPVVEPAELAWLEVPSQDVNLTTIGGLPA
jgi:hypothetical protein